MWRILGSVGLTLVALSWAAFSVVVVFVFVPALWELLFGKSWAVLGALAALAGMVWASARMLRIADRMMGMESHEHHPERTALAAADSEAHANWQAYADEIVLSKRWAFYRRTHQFDRLAALEAELRARKQ